MNSPLISTIAVSFALFVGCLATSVSKLGTLEPSIFHLQLTFSEAGFNAVLAQWGPADVARFKSHFAWDYGTLASYAVFGIAASRWVVERRRVTRNVELLLPWLLGLAATTDLAENLLHQLFTSAAAGQVPSLLFALAGACASTKFVLLLSWPVIAAVLLMRRSPLGTTRPTTS